MPGVFLRRVDPPAVKVVEHLGDVHGRRAGIVLRGHPDGDADHYRRDAQDSGGLTDAPQLRPVRPATEMLQEAGLDLLGRFLPVWAPALELFEIFEQFLLRLRLTRARG